MRPAPRSLSMRRAPRRVQTKSLGSRCAEGTPLSPVCVDPNMTLEEAITAVEATLDSTQLRVDRSLAREDGGPICCWCLTSAAAGVKTAARSPTARVWSTRRLAGSSGSRFPRQSIGPSVWHLFTHDVVRNATPRMSCSARSTRWRVVQRLGPGRVARPVQRGGRPVVLSCWRVPDEAGDRGCWVGEAEVPAPTSVTRRQESHCGSRFGAYEDLRDQMDGLGPLDPSSIRDGHAGHDGSGV